MNGGTGHTVHHYFKVKNIDDVSKVELALNKQNNRTFKYETPQYVGKSWIVWYHLSQTELTKALLNLEAANKDK